MWLLFVGAYATGAASALLVVLASTGIAIAGTAVELTLVLAFVLVGVQVVRLIADAHHRLLFPDGFVG